MRRSGATLTEVLMCLLIMSIGVVSVFSLFPISILSSIRATQVTNTKILQENMVEHLHIQPNLVARPIPSGGNWRGNWQPATPYAVDDLIMPPLRPGQRIPEPFFMYRCTAAGTSALNPPASWPRRELDSVQLGMGVLSQINTVTDGGATWTLMTPSSYVVDPLGAAVAVNATEAAQFGHRLDTGTAVTSPLARQAAAGYANTSSQLRTPFIHPDSWTVVLEQMPTNYNAGSIEFPTSVNLTEFLSSDTRMVIPLRHGNSAVRPFTIPGASYVADISGSGGFTVSEYANDRPVRFETFNPRYTCLLAVHQDRLPNLPAMYMAGDPLDMRLGRGFSSRPIITCAVFANRQFQASGEYIYDANWGNSSFTAEPRVDGSAPVALEMDQVKIAWTNTTSGMVTKEPDPLLRERNWIFDAREAMFYMISGVGPKVVSGTVTSCVLTLETPVRVRTTGTAATDVGRAMLMPGLVNVYDIEL